MFLAITSYSADEKGSLVWSDYDIIIGVCSYNEHSHRPDTLEGTYLGTYIQIPIVQRSLTRISIGVVSPRIEEMRRIRPEFSVSYLLGERVGLPSWLPLEVGAYVAVSPWNVVGLQLGLIKIDF